MVRSMYVRLPAPAFEQLVRIAEAEWRHPRDQAAYLITEALRQRGALPAEPALVGGEDNPPCEAGK
jgi:hypothetical protein